jgi:dTDP-4-amino-4,6-dideoxygalactose transaminase
MSDDSATREDPFIVFGAPLIGKAEIQEVVDCLRSGWIGTGPRVARFEEAFRHYKGCAHAVAVNSGTAALHLSMIAAGVGPGDEVITSALTFCATVNAIIHTGATPVLGDVDPVTMNLDPESVRARITLRTRAVLPVHFAGRACDMAALRGLTREHDLKLVEDCAHAIETECPTGKAGFIGDFGCFSFYVTKSITTVEGGMVLARNEADAARVKTMALHGMSKDAWSRYSDAGYKHYYVEECGYKYNMTDLQAAIGLHQLLQTESRWKRRRDIWNRYNAAFGDLPVVRPADPEPGTRHAFHLYTLLIGPAAGLDRDAFLDAMTRDRIGVGVHYMSIPEHPYYARTFGWRPEDYPHAMRIGQQTVSLPLSPGLRDRDVDRIIAVVRRILE